MGSRRTHSNLVRILLQLSSNSKTEASTWPLRMRKTLIGNFHCDRFHFRKNAHWDIATQPHTAPLSNKIVTCKDLSRGTAETQLKVKTVSLLRKLFHTKNHIISLGKQMLPKILSNLRYMPEKSVTSQTSVELGVLEKVRLQLLDPPLVINRRLCSNLLPIWPARSLKAYPAQAFL